MRQGFITRISTRGKVCTVCGMPFPFSPVSFYVGIYMDTQEAEFYLHEACKPQWIEEHPPAVHDDGEPQ